MALPAADAPHLLRQCLGPILMCGYDQPKQGPFTGAIGETFYKLYQPFMPYKDELALWEKRSK